jgi:hypothetical protein
MRGSGFRLHCMRYICGDFVLQSEHVAQVTLVGRGPKVFLRRGLNQVRRYSDPIPRTCDGPFDNCIDLQFARNLRDRRLRVLIVIYRGVRNDPQRTEVPPG